MTTLTLLLEEYVTAQNNLESGSGSYPQRKEARNKAFTALTSACSRVDAIAAQKRYAAVRDAINSPATLVNGT